MTSPTELKMTLPTEMMNACPFDNIFVCSDIDEQTNEKIWLIKLPLMRGSDCLTVNKKFTSRFSAEIWGAKNLTVQALVTFVLESNDFQERIFNRWPPFEDDCRIDLDVLLCSSRIDAPWD